MAGRGFGRIVNITSLSVYVPIPGLDLSSAARAGLTSFLAGIARGVAKVGCDLLQVLRHGWHRLRQIPGVMAQLAEPAREERRWRVSDRRRRRLRRQRPCHRDKRKKRDGETAKTEEGHDFHSPD